MKIGQPHMTKEILVRKYMYVLTLGKTLTLVCWLSLSYSIVSVLSIRTYCWMHFAALCRVCRADCRLCAAVLAVRTRRYCGYWSLFFLPSASRVVHRRSRFKNKTRKEQEVKNKAVLGSVRKKKNPVQGSVRKTKNLVGN